MATYDILITGCSSGIGLRTACRLAAQGHHVYATMRDLSKQDRLLTEAAKRQTSVEILQLDVTDEDSVREAMAVVEERSGKLDVLINNAGYGLGGAFEDLQEDEIRAIMETNFFGVQRVTRWALPLIRKSSAGKIINISSVAALFGVPVLGSYSASKYALEGFSESLRFELQRSGIYVVLVQPGSFQTRIWLSNRQLAQGWNRPESAYGDYARPLVQNSIKNYDIMSDPEIVARRIEQVIRTPKPALRYRVGWDCHLVYFLKLLPFGLFRWLVDTGITINPESVRKLTPIPEDREENARNTTEHLEALLQQDISDQERVDPSSETAESTVL